MPELPEVETIVRTLAPQVVGKTVVAAHVLRPGSLQTGKGMFDRLLPGARIAAVRRRAKLLLAELVPQPETNAGSFSGAGTPSLLLIFHLKMTGKFFVHPPDTPPLKHTRLIFDLAEARAPQDSLCPAGRLFFDAIRAFGYCRLMAPDELPSWDFWASLGPEPLETPDAALAVRFAARRAAIKAVLLDQRIVAGVGNIYADEALFQAGVHPQTVAASLPRDRLALLARSLKAILLRSIKECGSSIRDYRDAQGNAGAFQNSFAVYGRKGLPCPACGKTLVATRVAGRGTVFCPRCQAKG
jgi:formamidopyrimidine-DNA glycosylase